jgi:nicotinate-nucleotide adenylyltransferase
LRIGFFGGTFNPIHLGHLRAAEEAREKANLQRVVFIPSGDPPLKCSEILPSRDRLRLVMAAVSDNPYFDVSDIEISQEGKSYTVETVQKLCGHYRGHELFFITGIDAFMDLPLWYKPERLTSMIDFIVLTRPGYPIDSLNKSGYITKESLEVFKRSIDDLQDQLVLNMTGGKRLILLNITAINISSTMIRTLLKKRQGVRYLVPETILADINALSF